MDGEEFGLVWFGLEEKGGLRLSVSELVLVERALVWYGMEDVRVLLEGDVDEGGLGVELLTNGLRLVLKPRRRR